MALKLYNTKTKQEEIFVPIDKDRITMYCCGPTVYDYAHIGNARPVVVFDILYRLLKIKYKTVIYVRNITDMDDKIINRAKELGLTINKITKKYIKAYHDDMRALNALEPTIEPRARAHVWIMIEMIQKLIDKGHAYIAEDHVLFDISTIPGVGHVSGMDFDDLRIGARIDPAPYKKNPGDFILWKPSTEKQASWISPWGSGRPGWHIECSAMIKKHLGETIDIHGGGQDLIFPHHENENSQSMCVHDGKELAKYWIHNGYLTVDGEKMAKSTGNFITVNELLTEFPGEAIRLTLLKAHYRQPLDFSRDEVRLAKEKLDKWYKAISGVTFSENLPDELAEALDDDLNTPSAIARMDRLANEALDGNEEAARKLKSSGWLMGLLASKDWEYDRVPEEKKVDISLVEKLILERDKARAEKDFKTADEIRQGLADMGIVLEDKDNTTVWRYS